MSQSLVIHFIKKNFEKEIANIYYNWSGYTDSACQELLKILQLNLKPFQQDKQQEWINHLVQQTKTIGIYPHTDPNCNINDGVININQNDIQEANDYRCMDIFIDVINHKYLLEIMWVSNLAENYHLGKIERQEKDLNKADQQVYQSIGSWVDEVDAYKTVAYFLKGEEKTPDEIYSVTTKKVFTKI